MYICMQPSVLQNISGVKLSAAVRSNPGDTVIAYKALVALNNRTDDEIQFLQSVVSIFIP